MECFDRALEIDPEFAKAWMNKGLALKDLGRVNRAVSCFDRALAIDPGLAEAWYNKGAMLLQLGKQEEAIAYFDQALNLNPRFEQSWLKKGTLLAALGRCEEAILCLDQALELAPQRAQTWYIKGVTLAMMSDLHESARCLSEALRIDPDDPQVHTFYQQVLRQLDMESGFRTNPVQLAFEAFQGAGSIQAMHQAVTRFPFMTQADFIATVEQAIAQQMPPEHRLAFEQRLAWLRQISNEQK